MEGVEAVFFFFSKKKQMAGDGFLEHVDRKETEEQCPFSGRGAASCFCFSHLIPPL